ncbi:negative cofactor 2 transcription regulator complex subunit ncb2 [Savitreella phatthalungensis]
MDGADDELSLPKATVQKLVGEMLIPRFPDLSFSREARDLVIEMCVEFVHLLSSESNEVCEKESKKTIAAEHVLTALTELGFASYIPQIEGVVDEHKQAMKARERKVNKFESSGLSQDELLRQQEELLAQARSRFAQREESIQQQAKDEAAAATAAAAAKESSGPTKVKEEDRAIEIASDADIKQEAPRRGSNIHDLLN